MMTPTLSAGEQKRLRALASCQILDTEPERAYDDLAALAARLCDTSMAVVSLVDQDREWFKARVGIDIRETPRDTAIGTHVLENARDEVLEVADASGDERFAGNPLVSDAPGVRFHAAVPLVTNDNLVLGALCVLDTTSRTLTSQQRTDLCALASQVTSLLELARRNHDLEVGQKSLRRSFEDLEDFSYSASHDLQEPLRKLTCFVELLREDAGDDLPEAAQKDMHFITDAAQRMSRLVRDLLSLSRAGRSELHVTTLPLNECVMHAMETLSDRVAESEAAIAIDQLPVIRGDRSIVSQIFVNLLGNSLKFVGKATPAIRVTCDTAGSEPILSVRDNGIGIEESHWKDVFAPFRRLHRMNEYEGSGIGLAIVRRCVEAHGGSIWIESTPGEGTDVRFTLPGVLEETAT